jgi:hypothetical protein
MKSIAGKVSVVAGSLLIVAISLMIMLPQKSGAQQQVVGNTYSKVTLYSDDGKVLGTWTAVGMGQRDGNTLTFNVYRGIGVTPDWQVRINGTFTVEQTAP